MQRSSVLLPEPLLPMMQTTSLRPDLQVNAFEHFGGAKTFVQAADVNQRKRGRR